MLGDPARVPQASATGRVPGCAGDRPTRRPDAHLVLDTEEMDLSALRGKSDALRGRLDTLVTMFAAGELTGSKTQSGHRNSATTSMPSTNRPLWRRTETRWRTSSWALVSCRIVGGAEPGTPRGRVVDALMTVHVLTRPRGQRRFLPECVRVEWKRPA